MQIFDNDWGRLSNRATYGKVSRSMKCRCIQEPVSCQPTDRYEVNQIMQNYFSDCDSIALKWKCKCCRYVHMNVKWMLQQNMFENFTLTSYDFHDLHGLCGLQSFLRVAASMYLKLFLILKHP